MSYRTLLSAVVVLSLVLLKNSTAQELDFNKFNTADPLTTPGNLDDILGGGGRPFDDGRGLEIVLDPFADREDLSPNGTSPNGSSICNVTSKIEYRNSVIVRIVYIPSFGILFLSSLFLIYAILKFLKPLIKIYLSVIFYAACQLFLVLCLIISLISSNLYDESLTSCSITEPLQAIGVILPGYAVLAITAIRYLFLKRPMNWRNVLRMPYQITGFLLLIILAILLANLPNLGLCRYTLYTKGGLVQCRYSEAGTICTVFYSVYILFGFVLPPLGVLVLYSLIYRIIYKHRAYIAARTASGSRTASTKQSRASANFNSSTASEELLNSSSVPKEKTETERSTVPWSIIVLLTLNLLSTLPWVPQALYPDIFYGCQPGEIVLLVDIMWSVLIVSVALSPIAYLVTTQSVRDQIKRWLVCPCLKENSEKCSYHSNTEKKNFSKLSNV